MSIENCKDFGELFWIAADFPILQKRFLWMGEKKGKKRGKRGKRRKRGKRSEGRKRRGATAHTFRGKGGWGFCKCANPESVLQFPPACGTNLQHSGPMDSPRTTRPTNPETNHHNTALHSSRHGNKKEGSKTMTQAGTGTMRRLAAGIALAMTVALTGFGETVTNVRGSQRPNSNLVDIYYDLNASEGGTYTVEVSIEGRTDEVTATTFSGDVGEGIAPGKNRRIVWEAGADWRGKIGDVKAIVTATIEDKHNKVQLWAGGPYWADRNIGAKTPSDYGLYFWWGDTTGHRPGYNFSSGNSAVYTYGKSVSDLQSAGWVTSGGVLAPSHDAAHVKWGGAWRMPTQDELAALMSNCDWTWTTVNGVNGYVVRGRDEYASASIFLPAAGHDLGTFRFGGKYGYYWSSVPDSDDDGDRSWSLFFNPAGRGWNYHYRYGGQSVRPVQGFTK